MRWLALALFTVVTVVAQEAFTYTTQYNSISYRVPVSLIGPPIFTHRNVRLEADDNRIFVTAYWRSGIIKDTSLGRMGLHMVDWPEGCPNWERVELRLREHLARPGVKVIVRSASHQGVVWTVFEQRSAKGDELIALSCYAPLAEKEILYVGFNINDKGVSEKQREAWKTAVDDLLSSIRVQRVD